jgi:hypothetical protein
VLTALATCLGGAFAILREVAWIMLCAATAAAVLTALASRFRGTLAVVGEIAGTVLPAELAGA